MFAITTTMSAAHPHKHTSVGKRLEKQVAKLSTLRGQLEEKRRKQLWRIAKACDDMVKQELECIETMVGQPAQADEEDGHVHVDFKSEPHQGA